MANKVNASKFMGRGQSGLEKKVDANSKKITLLKNIIQSHKSDLGEKLASLSPAGGGLDASIQSITNSVTSISETLLRQQEVDKEQAEDAAIVEERKKRNLKEKTVEGGKNIGKGLMETGKKMLGPVKGFLSNIFDWIKKLLMAKVVMELFKWFSDPANAKKVSSIFRFIKDWWPAILTGLLLFAGSLLGPGGLILGAIILVTGFIPKLVNTVKTLLGFGKATEKDAADLEQKAKKGDEENISTETGQKQDVTPTDVANAPEPGSEQPVEMNKGGEVPGKGDRDTVPAMLTPGEFVMSKDAVSAWGKDTLEGMNAAAGGSNKPEGGKVKKYASGGEVLNNETGSLAKRIDPLITAQDPKPEGIGGMLAGAADFMTGGLFDFDCKSGGGLLSKGANVLGGMFGGKDKDGGADLTGAIADLQNRFNYSIYEKKGADGAKGATGSSGAAGASGGLLDGFISAVSTLPIVGKPLAKATGLLVDGVGDMIQQKHDGLHAVSGDGGKPMQVAQGQSMTGPVSTPNKPTTTVAYADAQSSAATSGASGSTGGAGGKVPAFDVGTRVSSAKIKVLGITR